MARLMTVQGWVPEHLLLRHPLHTAEWPCKNGLSGREGERAEQGREVCRERGLLEHETSVTLTSMFLPLQESTGLTLTRAVLGMPSGCSATSQQEGRRVSHPGMTSHRCELLALSLSALVHRFL